MLWNDSANDFKLYLSSNNQPFPHLGLICAQEAHITICSQGESKIGSPRQTTNETFGWTLRGNNPPTSFIILPSHQLLHFPTPPHPHPIPPPHTPTPHPQQRKKKKIKSKYRNARTPKTTDLVETCEVYTTINTSWTLCKILHKYEHDTVHHQGNENVGEIQK